LAPVLAAARRLDALHCSKLSRVDLPVVDLHDDALAIGQAQSVDAADAPW
jgi:hypothetical protein